LALCGTAEEAAEKGLISSETPKSMPQGLKPVLILLALYRDKSPAYRPNEFFRSL
jgi:hypothetical protein